MHNYAKRKCTERNPNEKRNFYRLLMSRFCRTRQGPGVLCIEAYQ